MKKRRGPLVVAATPMLQCPTGSNDSSTATLTPSVITVAKQPHQPQRALATTVTSSHNGVTNTTTTTLPAHLTKTTRNSKATNAGAGGSCDPLQRRSTEIIL